MSSVPSTVEQLRPLIERPPAITLQQLMPLALLDRTDTKFAISQEQLREILADSVDDYHVLEVNGVRPGRYVTTYFDTPDFAMYMAHHNGERYRYKLRCRSYLDSEMVFVEVKMKNSKDRMVKFRLPVQEHLLELSGIDASWLPPHFPYTFDKVRAVVWNRFRRVTLASFQHQERITVDLDIEFGCGSQFVQYAGLCIVEIKQPKFSLLNSPIGRHLHQMHLQPRSVSKFCVAAAHFYPSFKANRFKPLLLHLGRHFPLRGEREHHL
jgi:hypothetical protein